VEIGGPRLSYAQLWERAAAVAGGLRAGGFDTGDRAAILLPAGADWVLAFLGRCWPAGWWCRSTPGSPSRRSSTCSATRVRRTSSGRAGAALGGRVCGRWCGAATPPRSSTPAEPPAPPRVPSHARELPVQTSRPRSGSSRSTARGPHSSATWCPCRCSTSPAQHAVARPIGGRGTTVILPAFEVRQFLRTVAEERIDILVTRPGDLRAGHLPSRLRDHRHRHGEPGRLRRRTDRSRPWSSASRRPSRPRGLGTGSG